MQRRDFTFLGLYSLCNIEVKRCTFRRRSEVSQYRQPGEQAQIEDGHTVLHKDPFMATARANV